MRLYLSSFRVGDDSTPFIRLAGESARCAVIANALDAIPAGDRAAGVRKELNALAGLGFEPSEVDLRELSEADAVRGALAGYDALWVRGGNVFVLRRALAASGADAVVPAMLADDALVYAGYSAGPCVLAPSLRGLEACDDPADVGRAYRADARFDGLGVLPYAIVPHLDTPGHPESVVLAEVAARYDADGTPYRGLRDGEALVVDGPETYFVGRR